MLPMSRRLLSNSDLLQSCLCAPEELLVGEDDLGLTIKEQEGVTCAPILVLSYAGEGIDVERVEVCSA